MYDAAMCYEIGERPVSDKHEKAEDGKLRVVCLVPWRAGVLWARGKGITAEGPKEKEEEKWETSRGILSTFFFYSFCVTFCLVALFGSTIKPEISTSTGLIIDEGGKCQQYD